MNVETRMCTGRELFQGNARQIPDLDPVQIKLTVLNDNVEGVGCPLYLSSGLCDRPRVAELHKISGRSGTLTRCGAIVDRNQLSLISSVNEATEQQSFPVALNLVESSALEGNVPDREEADDVEEFEKPLRIEVGRTYRPFAEAQKFADVDWESHFDPESEQYSMALERELNLGGIKGNLGLNPFRSEDEEDEDPYIEADKPLGKIRVVKTYGDDDEEDGLEYPLSFYLNFEPRTFEEFEFLNELTLQIKCGGRTYYLNCYGDQAASEYIDEDTFNDLDEGETQILVDENLIGANGRETSALLPWDLEKIKEIEIRALTNEQYNEAIKV